MKLSERIGQDRGWAAEPNLLEALTEWADEVAQLEQRIERLEGAYPQVKISDGDAWLIFPNTMISIEAICKFGARGPIVRKNLRKWRDEALAQQEEA